MKTEEKFYAEPASPINWSIQSGLLIIFIQPGKISDELWGRFIGDVRTVPWSKCLGTSMGAIEVSSVQRSQTAAEFKGKRVAAITDHAVARGIATAMGWVGIQIRAWSWDSIEKAIDFLEMGAAEALDATRLLQTIRDRSLAAK